MSLLIENILIFLISFCFMYLIKNTFLKNYNFTVAYFMLHFIINFIITCMCLPYFLTLFKDPNGIDSEYTEYMYIQYTFPILNALHSYHLYNSYKNINYDEVIHHIITYVFWILNIHLNHPIYYVGLIWLSGVPGGITYLMLFLQNLKIITSLQEKYYSMMINFWIRGPGCIIYSTLLYDRMIYMYDGELCPIHIFIIGFLMINGIHFTTTIVDSYYRNFLK
jgi:hypothetical protein